MEFSAWYTYGFACFGALAAGGIFGVQSGAFFCAWMRTAVYRRVSIVWLLIFALLPFLIAYFAIRNRKVWLIRLSGAWEAFSFSALGCSVSVAFGSAGWLIRFLWMFSRCCSFPLLIWFHLRLLGSFASSRAGDLRLCCIAAIAIALTDYCLISPFLAMLI